MGDKDKRTRRSRNKLGRGLSALVDASPPAVSVAPDLAGSSAETSQNRESVVEIPLEDIHPNKNQPRSHFDEEALEELAASIRAAGLMQPIVVRKGKAGAYELIAGERRWRACAIAGLERVPALVRDVDEERSAEWALVENIQREDLNPIEKAAGYRRLIDRFGFTQQQVGERVGVSRASVANTMRLLDLDDSIQSMVIDGRLSMGHAKALLQCADESRRLKLAESASEMGWTVRALEQAASEQTPTKHYKKPEQSSDRERVDVVLSDLERQLGEHLGTRVRISAASKGTKGRVQFEFYDLDHFDGLMNKIGFSPDSM